MSVSLSQDRAFLDGEPVQLEQIGPRLSALGSGVRVIIATTSGTRHERVVQLIDHLRAHEVERFALRLADAPD